MRRALIAGVVISVGFAACTTEAVRDAAGGDPAVIAIEGGKISGVAPAGADRVWSYRGIPYAAPPVGNRRWRAPQPVVSWDGIRDATRFAAACLQQKRGEDAFYGQVVDGMSEDCLYLNVWSGAKRPERRPVMVWLHGGGLISGHGGEVTYDGAALAKRGVVVVTINYRLSVFGYLAHPLLADESEHHASGNYGTLDEIAALKWVQTNIAAFGGDPQQVTIFGESAGSWSVNHLTATPLAKGLFKRAIGQSGAGFGSFATASSKREVEDAGERFVKAVLGPASTPSLEALRAMSAEDILVRAPARVSPNVDGWVFPDTIYNIFAAGHQNAVPVIVGSNADEGASLGAGRGAMTLSEYRKMARDTYGDLAEQFLATYPAATESDVLQARIQSNTDQSFGWEMRTWARLTATTASTAYLYLFTRVPPAPDANRYGAFHAADVPYVFGTLGKSPYQYANRAYDEVDRKLSATMMSYWVNFATTGDPNGANLPRWSPYTMKDDNTMEFGDTVQLRQGIRKERLDFMDRFFAARRDTSH